MSYSEIGEVYELSPARVRQIVKREDEERAEPCREQTEGEAKACITDCTVSDLGDFPFDDFLKLQQAHRLGTASVGIDMTAARDWVVRKGPYCPQKAGPLMLAYYSPYLVALGLVIYSIVTRSWLLLLALPLFLATFFIFAPGARFMGWLRIVPIVLAHIGFVYSVIVYDPNWLAITLGLLVIFYGQQVLYRLACRLLLKAMMEHEDLFCSLWLYRLARINYMGKFFREGGL